MRTALRWLVQHPAVAISVHLVLLGTFAIAALRIRIESALENVLPAGDPEVQYYNDVRATFGSDDVAVIGVRTTDIFVPTTLQKIARVTAAVAAIPGVEQVVSITNAPDPAANVISPPRLLPRLPPTPDDIATLKTKLSTTPLYGKNLVADDFHAAAINIFFKDVSSAEYRERGIDARIRDILAAQGGPEEFFYTGAAHVTQATVDLMRGDLFRFTPIAVGLILVILWLAFRSWREVLLPMLSVAVALVWTLGIMGAMGSALTIGTFILPPLILVIGSSYAIHIVATYRQQTEAESAEASVIATLDRIAAPLLISAFTTGVGFASLMANRIVAVQDLGRFAVFGLAAVTISSLTLLPAMLRVAGRKRRAPHDEQASFVSQFLAGLGRRASAQRRAILWGGAVLALIALVGANRIRVDSDFITYFKEDSEVRRANEIINREIVGSNPFYLVVETSQPGQLERWEVLKQIKELQGFLNTLPGITTTISLVDWMELLETGLNQDAQGDLIVDDQGNVVSEGKPKTFWEDPRNLGPVLKMVSASPSTFSGFVTKDFSKANILVRTKLSGSREIEGTLATIRTYIAQHFPAEIRVIPTGNLVLLTGTSSDLVAGQIRSLTVAVTTIFLVFALMFLSARIGFLAVAPAVLPIVIFFGVLGWLGIRLDLGTSLIAAIALGLVVDATIHYLARLNIELKGETDQAAAVVRTIRAVGVPITYTAVALLLGFLTFTFSSFVPIQNFGLLVGFTMAAAYGCNVALLPALLATQKIITLWDLLGVRLGKDPTSTIPLLRGLRPAQARIVVLMGQLKQFAPGETIVRQGEKGNEMYVIIEGRAEIWAGAGGERKRLDMVGRGDVFGEMALVRQDERSADVVAAEPVEALMVNERFLSRIQSRYPRIAAKVFLNLTRILSDRLERANQRFVASRAT
jgi:predicted RND superfamily exporter protein